MILNCKQKENNLTNLMTGFKYQLNKGILGRHKVQGILLYEENENKMLSLIFVAF